MDQKKDLLFALCCRFCIDRAQQSFSGKQLRIYSTKQKEDLFSGPLHEIASSLVSRNYELHVCCGFVSKRKIYTYEEFLKTR
jgi:hypothetical protein